jgi:hypothetical protein
MSHPHPDPPLEGEGKYFEAGSKKLETTGLSGRLRSKVLLVNMITKSGVH